MRYFVFFILLAAFLAYLMCSMVAAAKWLLVWPFVSALVLMFGYLGNRPYLVCGKTRDGHVNTFLVMLNLPWLLITLAVWFARAIVSREPHINRIGETNVYISRWPVFGVDTGSFVLIVDLTAELPRLYGVDARYECLANLDGVALVNRRLSRLPSAEDKVLVHCAEGHGRSATFASCLLCEIGVFDTPLRAYEAVVASRPGARVSSSQMRQLESG